jgi:hypothetical protein
MQKKLSLLLLVFTGFSFLAAAQETNDAGLWCTFNVDKKLGDKFGVFLTEEWRQRENLSRLNLFYTDLGVSVKPADFIKISVAYRCIEKFQPDYTFSFRHRGMLDIVLKRKFGIFGLSYRQRIQAEVRDVYSSEIGNLPEWYSRNKFVVKFDLDRAITPYIGTELRYQIGNPRMVEGDGIWSRARYIAGIDYKRSDRHSFGLYYLVQREFNIAAPQNLYIIGLEYNLSLD